MVAFMNLYAFLDGKRYVLDGIDGTFQVVGKWPYERFMHVKSPEGREAPEYVVTKVELHDDWDSDLSNSIERLCQIAFDLGWEPGA